MMVMEGPRPGSYCAHFRILCFSDQLETLKCHFYNLGGFDLLFKFILNRLVALKFLVVKIQIHYSKEICNSPKLISHKNPMAEIFSDFHMMGSRESERVKEESRKTIQVVS